jgi:hypothetical protein
MSLSAAFSAEVRVGSNDSPRKPAVSAVIAASRAAMYSSTGLTAAAAAATKNMDIMVRNKWRQAVKCGFCSPETGGDSMQPHTLISEVTLRYFYSLNLHSIHHHLGYVIMSRNRKDLWYR